MTSETLTVAEAKRRFSKLLDRVADGERIVVTRRGKPAAALVSADDEPAQRLPPPLGLLAVVGALADVEGFDETMREVVASRQNARDRPAPDFG